MGLLHRLLGRLLGAGLLLAGGIGCNISLTPTCTAPLYDCNDRCVDKLTDPYNCGICGGTCATGASCSGGKCIPAVCGAGLGNCGDGGCVNFATDSNNCGACGTVCTGGNVCQNSVCASSVCGAGYTDCGGGNCKNLAGDLQNCGACGYVCPANSICSSGQCTGCGSSLVVCNGACANITNDPSNCGGCGVVCPNPYCTGGLCGP